MTEKILAALHAIMSEVSYVQRAGRNTFHKYNYAGEADLLEKLRPAMLKHGLLLIPSVNSVTPVDQYGNTTVQMEYTLAHKDGEVWPHPIGAAGTGNDRNSKGGVGDKGTYKAITGANKYLLFKLFQIETGDDPDQESEADKSPPPPAASTRVLDNDLNEPTESEQRIADTLIAAIGMTKTPEDLKAWKTDKQNASLFHDLPPALRTKVQAAATKRVNELNPPENLLPAG